MFGKQLHPVALQGYLTFHVDQVQSPGGLSLSIQDDGAVDEGEGGGAAGRGTGEDGFAVERVADQAVTDGEEQVVVGAVAGAGGLQVEELCGWGGGHSSG